jgi:hypothetical protein
VRREDRRVVGAADVLFAPTLAAALVGFSTNSGRSQLIQFGSLLIRKKLSVRISGRALQGISASLVQIPCKSGSPHGVLGAGPAFVAPASVVAVGPGASFRSATTATMITTTPIINAGNLLLIGTS